MINFKLIEVGSVRKTHGFSGEVKLIVEDIFNDDVEDADFYFIGKNIDTAIPYQVLNIRGSDWIVKLEDLNSKEEAAKLRGKSLFIRDIDITNLEAKLEANKSEFEQFEGLTIVDEKEGVIGKIVEIIDQGPQILAVCNYKEKEIFIPLHENLIIKLDLEAQTILMELPEGILSL